MKYKEDLVLEEIRKHVEATYKKHYATEDGLQVLDVWEALGSFDTSCRDAALKYIWRFGKKEGYNKNDVLKAIHFLMYIYQYHFLKEKDKELNLPVVREAQIIVGNGIEI